MCLRYLQEDYGGSSANQETEVSGRRGSGGGRGNDPEFSELILKAQRIKALQYSNNKTIQLSETVNDRMLPWILAASARLARYACDLRRDKFGEFNAMFLKDNKNLAHFEVRKITGYDSSSIFYVAEAKTASGNKVSASAPALHAIMSYLADRFVKEILPLEGNEETSGDSALRIAQTLSILSQILNDKFDPARKVGRISGQAAAIFMGSHKSNLLQ